MTSEERHTLGHVVHTSTREAVIADLVARGCGTPHESAIPEDGICIDMPGMISTKRPMESFVFEGLKLLVPCEDVAAFVLQLEKLTMCTAGAAPDTAIRDTGDGYYKLHAFHKALVLSPYQRTRLLAKLLAILPNADRRAREFYAVTPSASEVLREAASRVHGIPMEEVGDLGGHKNDHLRPRGGGKA